MPFLWRGSKFGLVESPYVSTAVNTGTALQCILTSSTAQGGGGSFRIGNL